MPNDQETAVAPLKSPPASTREAEWLALSESEKAARIAATEAKFQDEADCSELERCDDCGLVVDDDGYCEACEV